MPVMFTKGDLFHDHQLTAFAHGVSCAGNMDAGIALAFKKRWPAMYEDYRARCADKRVHLGDVLVWSDDKATVYSLAIQQHWKEKASLAALKRAVGKMVELAESARLESIGLPRMGTGMGGLDWNRAKSVLLDAGSASKVGLIVFEQFIRSKAGGEDDTAAAERSAADGDVPERAPADSGGKPADTEAPSVRPGRARVSAAARARKPSRR